jgi:hypothetical protein
VSIGIVRVSYGGTGENMGHVEVAFADSREPGFEIDVTIERVYGKSASSGSPWQTRCVGLAYRPLAQAGSWAGPPLHPSWVRRLPLDRIIDEAREAAREFEADARAKPGPRLPPGTPRRVNRVEWYRALLGFVDQHLADEWAPMDVYRLIADRKGVDVNNVKQWVFQARRLQEEG